MNYTQTQPQQYIAQQQPAMNYRPQMWPSQPIPQVRPVSSIEEVRAYPIDFDGSIFYFPDIANKKIYTKSMNLDGTVTINLYELKNLPTPTDHFEDASYITREEFETTITQIKNLYEQLLINKEQEMIQNAEQQQQAQKFQF